MIWEMRIETWLIIINKYLSKPARMCMWSPFTVKDFYQYLTHPYGHGD